MRGPQGNFRSTRSMSFPWSNATVPVDREDLPFSFLYFVPFLQFTLSLFLFQNEIGEESSSNSLDQLCLCRTWPGYKGIGSGQFGYSSDLISEQLQLEE